MSHDLGARQPACKQRWGVGSSARRTWESRARKSVSVQFMRMLRSDMSPGRKPLSLATSSCVLLTMVPSAAIFLPPASAAQSASRIDRCSMSPCRRPSAPSVSLSRTTRCPAGSSEKTCDGWALM